MSVSSLTRSHKASSEWSGCSGTWAQPGPMRASCGLGDPDAGGFMHRWLASCLASSWAGPGPDRWALSGLSTVLCPGRSGPSAFNRASCFPCADMLSFRLSCLPLRSHKMALLCLPFQLLQTRAQIRFLDYRSQSAQIQRWTYFQCRSWDQREFLHRSTPISATISVSHSGFANEFGISYWWTKKLCQAMFVCQNFFFILIRCEWC